MEKTITIDGKEVRFRATAALTRLYRFLHGGGDFLKDFHKLSMAYDRISASSSDDRTDEERMFSVMELELFENLAHAMAKHADPEGVPSDPGIWLEQFAIFDIYDVFPELFDLLLANQQTTVQAKKKGT